MRAAILVLVLASPVGADWLVFRGDPSQTGYRKGELPARLEVLWKFQAEDAFEGAVAVHKGVVYAGSMDEHLYALGLKDGKQKWKYKGGPFKAPPAVIDGVVHAGDLDGALHQVSAEGKGKKLFEAGSELGGLSSHEGLILAPSHDENLYGLTREGKEKWKFKAQGPIYGSVSVSQGKTFLVGCDSKLHVINVADGKEDREVELDAQTGGTAAVEGDLLYIGTMGNVVKAINWKKGSEAWTYKPGRHAQAFFSSPALTKDLVVIGSRDKRVHGIRRKDGTQAWTFQTEGQVDSSPIVVGDKVIAASLDSCVYVLDLAKGTLVQKLELDGPISASPAYVDGKVLIGTQKGTLYCLGGK
jgi:outer membrane protein assembly factor BamB